MDLGGGWYDDEALMDEVRKMAALNVQLQKTPHESLADILVVTDEDCIRKMSISKTQRQGFMEDLLMELALSGGVADHYRLKDLPQLDLTRYKMVIFAYTFAVSSEMRAYLENNLPKNALLVFHHAAGIRKDFTGHGATPKRSRHQHTHSSRRRKVTPPTISRRRRPVDRLFGAHAFQRPWRLQYS
jgi:hypothetical protein